MSCFDPYLSSRSCPLAVSCVAPPWMLLMSIHVRILLVVPIVSIHDEVSIAYKKDVFKDMVVVR